MGSIIGSVIGEIAGGDDRRAGRDAMSEATGAFRDIKIPSIEEQRIILKQLVSQGEITPEMEQDILANPSKMEQIAVDKQLRDAQMNALQTLKQVGQTGLNAEDRAALNEVRLQINQQDKAKQDAILQNLAARGMGGAGTELAQRLAASQNSAENAAAAGDRLAATALQRKLDAIAKAGALGSQLEQQQFGEEAQKASAADIINKFNTQNRLGVQSANVQAKNAAQVANLANKQRISDTNVGLANQQEQYNKGLYQQQFQNQLNKAAGLSGQLRQNQAQYAQDAARKAQMYSSIGEGLGGSVSALSKGKEGGADSSGGIDIGSLAGAAAIFSDEKLKKDIKKFDPEKFLEVLKAYQYKYKDKKDGEGKQVGVMANDVEKEVPQMVEETPHGKLLDYNKAGGPILASLAHLHERLKKLEDK